MGFSSSSSKQYKNTQTISVLYSKEKNKKKKTEQKCLFRGRNLQTALKKLQVETQTLKLLTGQNKVQKSFTVKVSLRGWSLFSKPTNEHQSHCQVRRCLSPRVYGLFTLPWQRSPCSLAPVHCKETQHSHFYLYCLVTLLSQFKSLSLTGHCCGMNIYDISFIFCLKN